jgi:hypothetical protein
MKALILIAALLVAGCKFESSEERWSKINAPCITFCQPHGGFSHVADQYTGGFANKNNRQCVCKNGVTVPR